MLVSKKNDDASGSVSDPPYVLEDQIGFVLRLAVQRHVSIFTNMIGNGLKPAQFACLVKLLDVAPCSQNELGRLIMLDPATIKGVVDRLRARGFVVTVPDAVDRRRHKVDLTPEGRAATLDSLSRAGLITEATLAPLSARDRERLLALLRKIAV